MSFFHAITEDFAQFKEKHVPKGRLLGIDYGKKNCGMAMSDPSMRIATAFGVMKVKKFTIIAQELENIIRENMIVGLVIGCPKNLDNSENKMSQSVRQFARNLIKCEITVPILLCDERYSSQAIDRIIIKEGDLSRARQKKLRDKLAASYILQSYCDFCTYKNLYYFEYVYFFKIYIFFNSLHCFFKGKFENDFEALIYSCAAMISGK